MSESTYPTFQSITISAKLDGSESSFNESFSSVGIPITVAEARLKALEIVDRMFPNEDILETIKKEFGAK